jgi:lipid A ethanolaminephosphotransferase
MRVRQAFRTDIAIVAATLFIVAACNVTFWQQLVAAVSPHSAYEYLFIAGIVVLACLLLALFMSLFAAPYIFKPAVIALLLITAPASYFTSEYGTVIDGSMLKNVLLTNTNEVADLLTPGLAFYVLAFGVLPSVVLWACPIVYRPWRSKIGFRAKSTLVAGLTCIAIGLVFSQNISSVFRQNRLLLGLFAPLNVVSASAELTRKSLRAKPTGESSYGHDARKSSTWATRHRKSVTVIVVGETARADHFSLNGYPRATNPLLAKVPGLVSFTQAYSCGTNTGLSLPCMFSGLGARSFSNQEAAHQDGLLDILQRASFSVLWRENQAGCYGVCKRVPTDVLERAGTRTLFERGESFDENLLHGLQEKIERMGDNAVIVLHMMGSHGPTYYKRYPPAFEHFQPTCKESQFSRCSLPDIINSYDNTLVYSDYVLARLVELLQANDRNGMATAMIYLSDHGESLGEANVYLHGMPYRLAPEAQKHIPLLLWLSPNYRSETGTDVACLEGNRNQPVSHDNLFHSVLGLLDVQTRVYDRNLDIFAPCRTAPHQPANTGTLQQYR